MAIQDLVVEIYGVQTDDGMLVYDSDKAPAGGHLIDAFGNTVFVKNGELYVIVDPNKITSEEDPKRFFKVASENGVNRITYCRIWKYDPITNSGYSIVSGKEAWVEYRGHIREYNIEDPKPVPVPVPEPQSKLIDGIFEVEKISFKGGKLRLHLHEVEE